MNIIPIRLRCPNCGVRERMPMIAPLKTWQSEGGSLRIAPVTAATFAAGATVCPNCNTPFGVTFTANNRANISGIVAATNPDQADIATQGSNIQTFPKSRHAVEEDPSLPEKIREAFVFIQEDAQNKRNPAGILSGARACLDVALKELGEVEGGRKARINSLASRGIITLAIATWAQTLWQEGSDAVHDLDANIDRAIEHVEFLKLFFEVAFSLPARIEEASHGVVEAAGEPVTE